MKTLLHARMEASSGANHVMTFRFRTEEELKQALTEWHRFKNPCPSFAEIYKAMQG